MVLRFIHDVTSTSNPFLLISIPLCIYGIYHTLSILLLVDIWTVSNWELLWIFKYKPIGGKFLFRLSKYLGVELDGLITWLRNWQTIFQSNCMFCIPTSNVSSRCSTSLSTLGRAEEFWMLQHCFLYLLR